MLHYLKFILQILMAPKSGWEDVIADRQQPRDILLKGFLPLAAVAALSVGVNALYQIHPAIDKLIIKALVVFTRYTLTYFIAVALLLYALPKITDDNIVSRPRIELLSAYCVGMMAIIGILKNLLPMELPLLQFLPFYIIVVIIQSRQFINIDDKFLFRYAACATAGIILPVFIIDRLLLP